MSKETLLLVFLFVPLLMVSCALSSSEYLDAIAEYQQCDQGDTCRYINTGCACFIPINHEFLEEAEALAQNRACGDPGFCSQTVDLRCEDHVCVCDRCDGTTDICDDPSSKTSDIYVEAP